MKWYQPKHFLEVLINEVISIRKDFKVFKELEDGLEVREVLEVFVIIIFIFTILDTNEVSLVPTG